MNIEGLIEPHLAPNLDVAYWMTTAEPIGLTTVTGSERRRLCTNLGAVAPLGTRVALLTRLKKVATC